MKLSGIISLLTDFGEADGYVGTMKGVILSINPRVHIVDISHQVPSHNIDAGAFLLNNTYRYFPVGTIHVVVIDPGVGSERRAIAVVTEDHIFLAPDNGVLKYIFHKAQKIEVVELSNKIYFLKPISRTFHGRDIFAPVAAHLSSGVSIFSLGPTISDFKKGEIRNPVVNKDSIVGRVAYVDKFGNLITNISEALLQAHLKPGRYHISVGKWSINKLHHSYAEALTEQPIALIGSSGYLEISVNQGSAHQITGLKTGDSITIYLK